MKKLFTFLNLLLFVVGSMYAYEGGSVSANPGGSSIYPASPVTITYNGAGTNFSKWAPQCHVHIWLVPKDGVSFSKSYTTSWLTFGSNGDDNWGSVPNNQRMTKVGSGNTGVYEINISSIYSFFSVDEVDKDKIKQLGVIVRAQFNGDNNRTDNMFLTVHNPPSITFNLPSRIYVDNEFLLQANAENVNNADINFFVKEPGSSEFTPTGTNYTPTVVGDYTFKAELKETDQSSVLAIHEKTISAVEPIVIRAKLPESWENPYILTWGTQNEGFNAMIKDGDWYSYTFIGEESINFLFAKNNHFSDGDNSQTVDVENTTESKCYLVGNEASGKRSITEIICNYIVENDIELNITENKTYGNITVKPTGKLTIAANTTLTIIGTLTLQSDATGTGTLVGNYSGTATVEQHLASYRSWYMSLPVSGSVTNTGVADFYKFTESTDAWEKVTDEFTPGKGVLVNPTDNTIEKISFSGTLNNDDVNLTGLTATAGKKRFHYVGNPYASYLDWSQLAKTNLEGTIWFRTKVGGEYKFATYNQVAGTELADNTIAPMQGFWVRVEAGKSGTLGFNNENRGHYTTGNKLLRAPQVEFPFLRLEVSDGTLKDEAVVYFKEENLNEKDRYDAAKMMNGNNIPEIWTIVNNEATVINAMQSVPYNVEMPLGFNTKKADTFTIRANQFKGFTEGDRILLIDKVSGSSTDITTADYSFSSDAIKTNNRFAIVFAPGTTTGFNSTAADAVSVYTRNKDLVLSITNFNNSTATLYSISGQQIASHALTATTTTLASNLSKGVYLVVIENGNDKITKRVVVK